MTRAVVLAAAVVAATAPGAARADTTIQPTELVFAADETGAGSSVTIDTMSTAAATRADAAAACFAKREIGEAVALALVVVDKKGKTKKIAVGGTNDAALDKCLEKAIKGAAWPATSAGGAMVLAITTRPPKPGLEVIDPAPSSGFGASTKTEADVVRTDAVGTFEIAPSGGASSYQTGVMTQLRSHTRAFGKCYEKALEANPKLTGPLVLTITIGGDGKVVAASLGAGADPGLASCMAKVAKAIRFSAPPNNNAVDVVAPFNLNP